MKQPATLKSNGFTLIEVLLAMTVLAIALTALVKSLNQSVVGEIHIKHKTMRHIVAMQGMHMIQIGLVNVPANQELTEVTQLYGQRWYWRAWLTASKVEHVQQITITVSDHASGPFTDPLIGYRYQA